ncbi:MAG: SDR family oxidoreductase [Pseudomonadota bacterium]|nr:SDR family oxidoreductase [Pseudomonadota bacterium]
MENEIVNDKVCIITGGSRGLGKGMTLALTAAGAKVIAPSHIPTDIPLIEKDVSANVGNSGGEVYAMSADLRNPDQCCEIIDKTLEKFGKLDVLVNNAGLGMRPFSEEFMETRPKFWEADIAQVQMTFDTNTIGPFQMAAHAIPHMLKRGWGRIVNVTTSIGTMQRKGFFPYGPSKTALEASTRIWAEDLENTGITSNVLIPGRAANTDIMPTAWRNSLEHPAGKEPVEPDVMGPPILWLASNASDGITGQRFEADIWDTSLDPTSAALKQICPAGFELRSRSE